MPKTVATLFSFASVVLVHTCLAVPALADPAKFVVTNDDSTTSNTATVYRVKDGRLVPTLKLHTSIATGGSGDGGGYVEGQQQAIVRVGGNTCLYVGDAGSPDVAAIDLRTGVLLGNFHGSENDAANGEGIGLLPSPDKKFLYADFRPRAPGQGDHIAIFQIGSGCQLTFQSDVAAFGMQSGGIEGMAAHDKTLVVAFGDGSIQSFRISGATLKSNHDEQNSTGFVTHNNGLGPGSVQITSDGHFAVFGDVVSNRNGDFTEIEVSDISSGKLTPTVDYGGGNHSNGDLGPGLGSNSTVLSSDQMHLYVSNPFSGQVTVLGFDAATGVVSPGCISAPLKGFGTQFTATAQIAAGGVENGKDVAWLAEDGAGNTSGVGIVQITVDGASCTATESSASPASDPNSVDLKSLSAF